PVAQPILIGAALFAGGKNGQEGALAVAGHCHSADAGARHAKLALDATLVHVPQTEISILGVAAERRVAAGDEQGELTILGKGGGVAAAGFLLRRAPN